MSIPATVFSAYIILGILLIGSELENPFGNDVSDLPLDDFCKTIATELDVISSRKKPNMREIITSEKNKVLFPLSHAGYPEWAKDSEEVIRAELKYKAEAMSKRCNTRKMANKRFAFRRRHSTRFTKGNDV
jgi:ion channel-forming bestrophin family protein